MNDLTQCPDPDRLITLLYDDEGTSTERATLEAHLSECASCTDLLATLDRTRTTLGAWQAARPPLGFAVVQAPPLWRRILPWSGMAAAAVLVLAASAGLAGLDIRYDDRGFQLRTGWHGDTAATTSTADVARTSERAATAVAPAGATAEDPRTAWLNRAADGEPPWRADFDLLATQIRTDLAAQARATEARLVEVAAASAASRPQGIAGIDERELTRRIAEQIDQSEVRQQQNLALRVAELGREFQLRRQADLVQFEQGLARVEQQRRDLIRRVAVGQAPQP